MSRLKRVGWEVTGREMKNNGLGRVLNEQTFGDIPFELCYQA